MSKRTRLILVTACVAVCAAIAAAGATAYPVYPDGGPYSWNYWGSTGGVSDDGWTGAQNARETAGECRIYGLYTCSIDIAGAEAADFVVECAYNGKSRWQVADEIDAAANQADAMGGDAVVVNIVENGGYPEDCAFTARSFSEIENH